MKKHIFRFVALFLCISLLSVSLCGCSKFLELLPFGNKLQQDSPQYTLPGTTNFRTEPSWDAPIVATLYEGVTIAYGEVLVAEDGTVWAHASDGWFALEGSEPPAYEVYNSYATQKDGIACVAITVYEEPYSQSQANLRLDAGAPMQIYQMAETNEGIWGRIEAGWFLMEDIYLVGQKGQRHCYGVTRDDNVKFYSAPGYQYGVTGTADSAFRFEVMEQLCIDGIWWGCTAQGWVCMDAVYEEGTTGQRPCTAMVIDPTPLNVRTGPSTDYEVVTTLTYGDYVNILEQVDHEGSDWGFIGTGWVFMGLVEVQE